jgi:YfiH family protein
MTTSISMATTTSTCRPSSSSDPSLPAISLGWSSAADGDLGGAPPRSEAAPPTGPLASAPGPWTWLRQVHGARAVLVTRPGEHAGDEADAAVTATPGCTIAIRTADCAPVVLEGATSVAVLHLGWRSVVGGLVAETVSLMGTLGDRPRVAHLGPCIRPECYEFGPADLDRIAERFGPSARGTTAAGRPALDLPAVVGVALLEQGVTDLRDCGTCTAHEPGWFSHRARRDGARFATAAWIEA